MDALFALEIALHIMNSQRYRARVSLKARVRIVASVIMADLHYSKNSN